jgi:carbonic anhydrase
MNDILSAGAKARLVGLVVLLLASAATIWAGFRNGPAPEAPPPQTPEAVLAELKAGNERFVRSQRTKSVETRGDAGRRKEQAQGEKPVAAVVTCADSRVVPEFLFDQALGRLLTIHDSDRDAAGVLGEAADGQHASLVVVLAHAGCEPSTDEQARKLARSYVRESAMLREALRQKRAALAIAVYDLGTGRVAWSDFDPDAEK